MALLLANVLVNTPHLDVMDRYYPDMPVPALGTIPAMCDYNVRDTYVKLGCSTVDLRNNVYLMKDLVTTYRPEGEEPPAFRWVRDLGIDFNIEYGWQILVRENFSGHTLCADNDTVDAENIVKPKMAVGVGYGYAEQLGRRALIADVPFMQSSIAAGINETNQNRLDIEFDYKRTGMGRIVSTRGRSGFNFG